MYYHVLIEKKEKHSNSSIHIAMYELDRPSLREIENEILLPYLNNTTFEFDGRFISKADVERIKVFSSQSETEDYVMMEVEKNRARRVAMAIFKKDILYYDQYVADITKETLKKVLKKVTRVKKHPTDIVEPDKRNVTDKSIFKMETRNKPFVFIGSSAEGLEAAKGIQANLDYTCECQIWSQGLFGLSGGTLETLVKSLNKFDFAILVLTEDDITISRDVSRSSPRDNVIFELGLFIGGLGLRRTFIVVDRQAKLKLPSDLGGITPATFEPPVKGTIQSALGAACLDIEQAIDKFGGKSQSAVTAHWWTKCAADGVTELPDYFLTVFNRTDNDVPWLNVNIFPSNSFQLEPITPKKDFLMAGQYAMYQFRMYKDDNGQQLTSWAEHFSNKIEGELSIRVFKEHSASEPVLISYELGANLYQRIQKYK